MKNWIKIKLGDPIIAIKGKKPKNLSSIKDGRFNIPYINIKAFETKIIDEYTDGEGALFCEDSDLLMVWDGSRSGFVGKAIKGALGSTLMKLIIFTINREYVNYFLLSKFNDINSRSKGVGIPHVDPNILWNYELPLPPLNEQNRIVDKLNELLSELEKGKEQLQTSMEQLKVYRQSILKYAFEGKLTARLRKKKQYRETKELIKQLREKGKELKIKLKYPQIKDDEELPSIPKEWQWIRNEELLKYVTSGSRDWKKYYSPSGSIFIRTQDIKTNNLSLENAAYVKLPTKAEGKRSLVELNDILMTITGANVGKVALIDKEIPEAYVSQSVALMRYLDSRLTKFMWYYFQSRAFGQGLISNLVYGVGRPVLSLENMKEVPVALCSIEEQEAIVNEIENRFSVCDKMENEIIQSLNQLEPLKQGLLQKAFKGKLLEQNPADEPVSVLLERIKKEREEYLKVEKESKKKPMKKKSAAKVFEFPIVDTIKDKFGMKSFTFDQLKSEVNLNYDDLREELFSILDNEKILTMEFDQKKESMNFKYVGK